MLEQILISLTLEQEILVAIAFGLSAALGVLKYKDFNSKELVEEVLDTKTILAPTEANISAPIANYEDGLIKSRGFLVSKLISWIGSNNNINEKNAQALEDILISADLGVKASQKIVSNVLASAKSGQSKDLMVLLKLELQKILKSEKAPDLDLKLQPTIILIVGVNGAGKTTTIAKFSKLFKSQGKRVLVAAADTFRAAAVDQLSHWANKIGVDIEYKEGENIKPATIVFDAISRLKNEKQDVLIIDTAGRLHNRVNLMNELESIKKSIQREFPDAPHETLLVLDGSSGQNALQQAREFNERAPLTGLVITKLDGTSKGGIVVAIRDELNIDVRYIGLGEGEDDLMSFDPEKFVKALIGEEELNISYKIDSVEANAVKPEINNLEADSDSTVIERKVVRKRRENGH